MSSVPVTRYTAAEYLAIERKREFKSDFYRGEIFAMAGASLAHNLITLNIGGELRQQLRDRDCLVFTSDMRVSVSADLYTYPDVVVTCSKPQFLDGERDTLINPRVLIEVLSNSTEVYDKGTKFHLYRQLPSIQEVCFVAQDEFKIERYTRQPSGDWLLTVVDQPAQSVQLTSIDCTLNVAEVYAKVDFSQ